MIFVSNKYVFTFSKYLVSVIQIKYYSNKYL